MSRTERRPWLRGAVLLCVGFAGSPAAAQDGFQTVDQIGSATPTTQADQISNAPPLAEAAQPSERGAVPPVQLSGPGESARGPTQLTRPGESAGSSPQLYRGGPTAQPAAALSTPAEGRTSEVARVGGRDRCDPDAGSEGSSDCTGVIENRAFEFARPTPTKLSPEQRLLVEQPREEMGNAQAAARRLATNAGDPNSMEDQSIASIVLSEGQRTQQRPVEQRIEDTAPAGVIEAIVGAITGTPPQP